ncbi:MAG: RodZ domain-containing protein [Endomicrobiaceae bacterium]
MDEIGKILKQARKKKRYSLEKIRKITKIKESYIIGLENSDINAFPAEVYYKNFLKSYSKYLGLNPDEILKMYEESKLIKQDDLFKHHENIDETRSLSGIEGGGRSKLMITLITAAVMFIFLLAANSYILNDSSCAGQSGETAAIQDNAAIHETPPAAERTKQTLFIKAFKNTWIRIDSDDKKIYEDTLYAGKEYKAFAYDNFVVKIGNVESVEVYFNDNKIDVMSGASQNKVNTITLKKS